MAEQEVSCLPSTLVTAKRGSLASSERYDGREDCYEKQFDCIVGANLMTKFGVAAQNSLCTS